MSFTQTNSARREVLYLILVTFFSVTVIVSNLITCKLVSVPFLQHFLLPCGLITYPFTFLISDLVTEIYGQERGKFMVYMGFTMSIVAHLLIQFAVYIPPHPDWHTAYNPAGYTDSGAYQTAFASVFNSNGIALFSSMAAYVVSQILDIRLFAFLKELTKNRYLWLRNGGSTLVSQVIDTLVVSILFLYCGMKLPLHQVITISMICYLYKVIFTVSSVPLFYLAVNLSQRFLNGKKQEIMPISYQEKTPQSLLSTE